jgi:dTDP-glucose 4,6-dehydratase
MSATDGRVVTNFITQALNGDPITIYGNGRQTRSFCYIDDLICGILMMIDSAEPGPINLGNPEEFTIADFAELVLRVTGSSSPIVYRPLPEDDPARRRPDIGKARMALGWQPEVRVEEGVRRTVEWLQSRYYSHDFAQLGKNTTPANDWRVLSGDTVVQPGDGATRPGRNQPASR